MGIASVVSIYTIGAGFNNVIKKEFESLGTNTVLIFPFKLEFSKASGHSSGFTKITLEDFKALKDNLKEINLAIPKISGQTRKVFYKNKSFEPEIIGTSPEFFMIGEKKLKSGSYFGTLDLNKGNKVAVLGAGAAEELFEAQDPVGKKVILNHVPFEVIGVLEKYPKGKMYFGHLDKELIIPHTTSSKIVYGKEGVYIREARLIASEGTNILSLKEKVKELLRQRKKVKPDEEEEFTVTTAEQFTKIFEKLVGEFISFLSVTAFISLLIGGIGIMNIMLVSSTERTREIGIRMALGARSKEIIFQFLIEAVILCLLGGGIGILLAVPASLLIAKGMEYPTQISWWIVILAFLYSSGIGIIFGYYPAKQASNLDPIEALKYE